AGSRSGSRGRCPVWTTTGSYGRTASSGMTVPRMRNGTAVVAASANSTARAGLHRCMIRSFAPPMRTHRGRPCVSASYPRASALAARRVLCADGARGSDLRQAAARHPGGRAPRHLSPYGERPGGGLRLGTEAGELLVERLLEVDGARLLPALADGRGLEPAAHPCPVVE